MWPNEKKKRKKVTTGSSSKGIVNHNCFVFVNSLLFKGMIILPEIGFHMRNEFELSQYPGCISLGCNAALLDPVYVLVLPVHGQRAKDWRSEDPEVWHIWFASIQDVTRSNVVSSHSNKGNFFSCKILMAASILVRFALSTTQFCWGV